MKLKLGVVIVVPLLCLGICWGSAAFMRGMTAELAQGLTRVQAALDNQDWAAAANLVRDTTDRWETGGLITHMIVHVRDSQELTLALGGLTASIQAQEESEARIMAANALARLALLSRLDAPLLENLL